MVNESVSQSMSLSAVCLLSVYLSQYHPLGRNGVIMMSLKPRKPIFRNYRIFRPCFIREMASAKLCDIIFAYHNDFTVISACSGLLNTDVTRSWGRCSHDDVCGSSLLHHRDGPVLLSGHGRRPPCLSHILLLISYDY